LHWRYLHREKLKAKQQQGLVEQLVIQVV
jgi:hypothetical protein